MHDLHGFFNCGKGKACTEVACTFCQKPIKEFMGKDNNKNYKFKDYITCNTVNVIYIIECPCGEKYVGKTCQKLKTCIRELCRNIRLGLPTHSLSAHYQQKHDQNPIGTKFWAVKIN